MFEQIKLPRLMARNIRWTLPAALVLAFAVSGTGQTTKGTITVGPNVQVSEANGQRDHYEVWVAADPKNPKDLIGCSIIEPKQPTARLISTVVYSSFDGGASWEPTLESDAGNVGTGDPDCVFGNDGRAYFTTIMQGGADQSHALYGSHLLFYRSDDEGKAWSKPVKLPYVDREWVSVDMTRSKYRGRLYITGNGFARPVGEGRLEFDFTYFRSEDFGETFSEPYLLSAPANHTVQGEAQSAILSDGTIVVLFSEHLDITNRPMRPKEPTCNLDIIRSTDGGLSFSRATVAAPAYVGYSIRGNIHPSLAVDNTNGPFKDQLYAVWADYRSGRSEILMTRSSDKGTTWSKPIVINDDESWERRAGPDDVVPVVAVNHNGVIGVMWYDRRDNPDDLGYYVRFSASVDGGETFLPSVKVSEAPQTYAPKTWRMMWYVPQGGGDPKPGAPGGDLHGSFAVNTWRGDTAGMAASADGAFHPFWVDNRTGIQQVWTAAVNVNGDAVPNGSAGLANWKDVTSEVFLEFGEPIFDASRQTLSVDAYLVNTSHDPIHGPLELRFVTLKSNFDAVDATNADNRVSGPGAVFNFINQPPGEVLRPGERSLPKHLVFRIAGLHALLGSTIDEDPPVLFNYNARVLAPPEK